MQGCKGNVVFFLSLIPNKPSHLLRKNYISHCQIKYYAQKMARNFAVQPDAVARVR